MAIKFPFALLVGMLVLSAPARAEPDTATPAQKEASIPFINAGGLRDWRTDGDDAVYIQDNYGDWYKATLLRPALDLPYVEAIGFDAGPMDRLDRFSSVIVRGESYAFKSLERVPGPPQRAKGHSRHS